MQALRIFVRGMATEKCLNRVTLIGRAGADAQLKGTLEHPVVIFNIATNTGPKTEWHRISVFRPGLRQVAEEYVKSGTRLFLEGKLSHGHIVDAQGHAVPTTSIIADDIIFLSNKGGSSQELPEMDESTN